MRDEPTWGRRDAISSMSSSWTPPWVSEHKPELYSYNRWQTAFSLKWNWLGDDDPMQCLMTFIKPDVLGEKEVTAFVRPSSETTSDTGSRPGERGHPPVTLRPHVSPELHVTPNLRIDPEEIHVINRRLINLYHQLAILPKQPGN